MHVIYKCLQLHVKTEPEKEGTMVIMVSKIGFIFPDFCCYGNDKGILVIHQKCISFIEYLHFRTVCED